MTDQPRDTPRSFVRCTPEHTMTGCLGGCVCPPRNAGVEAARLDKQRQAMTFCDRVLGDTWRQCSPLEIQEAITAHTEAVVAEAKVDTAHKIRLIFKDAATFYEIKECLALANELDPAAKRGE